MEGREDVMDRIVGAEDQVGGGKEEWKIGGIEEKEGI